MSNDTELIKLHLGCGTRRIPGWIHIDIVDHPHVDFCTEAHNLSMLQDESCSIVYASHILEYYDWQEAQDMVLLEWERVLVPGGTLRLALPNFEVHTKLYAAGLPLDYFIGPLYGKIGEGKNRVYHKSTYDYPTAKTMLINAGFTEIRLWDWRTTEHAMIDDFSQSYIPHMHKDKGILMSLNIEARKDYE
jgi:ubiquinone/menaquinone biosynthesis C-methylase UbiE